MKKNAANLAKSPLVDWSAVAIAVAYTAAQSAIESIPDLPQWALGLFVVIAVVRALAIQFLADRDGDGVPDYKLTPASLADGLREGVIDFEAAKAVLEKHAQNDENSVSPDETPVS